MSSDKSAPSNAAPERVFEPRRSIELPEPESPAYQRMRGDGSVEKTISGGSGLLGMATTIGRLQAKRFVTRPFEEVGWVHTLIKAISNAASSVPLEIWNSDPAADKNAQVLAKDDPLMRVLRRPTPHMTQAQFIEAGAQHRKLEGEDFWILLGEDGKPIRLTAGLRIPIPRWILTARGSSVTVLFDPTTGWPREYKIAVMGALPITAPPEAVIHFRDYNPDDPRRGLGDAEAAATLMDLEHQADRYQRSILANSGDPGGYIIQKNGPPAPETAAATENQVNQQRGPTEAGRWKMIPGDVTYEPYKIGPKDMDFPRMREWNRDYFAAIFGVPLPIIGVLQHATLANFDQSVAMFWDGGNGIIAYLRSVEDVLNNRFLPNLDRSDAEKLVARFNTKAIKALQEDMLAQIAQALAVAKAGLGASFAEAMQIVGHELDPKIAPLTREHFSPSNIVLTQDVIDGKTNQPPPAPGGDKPGDTPPADESTDGKTIDKLETREAEADPDPAKVAADARRAYWASKDASLLQKGEKELRSRYRGFRKEYERATYKRIRDYAVEGGAALRNAAPVVKTDNPDGVPPPDDYRPDVSGLILPKEPWSEKMATRMQPGITVSWSRGLNDLAEELNSDLLMNGFDPNVVAAIRTQVSQLVDGHIDFLNQRVGDALSNALSQATNQSSLQAAVEEVLPQITDNLRQVFGDRTSRAATIARTETARAVNGARNMGMKQAGIVSQEWVTQEDQAVRGNPDGAYPDAQFSHFELDGKTWPVGAMVDASKHHGLKYPGDPDAEPGDTINCRCLARPVQADDTSGDQQ
jgi:HK97 family phage portal protein